MNNQSRQALWLALAGSIVLMIGMGYGRLPATGVLPLMLNEGLLTLHGGQSRRVGQLRWLSGRRVAAGAGAALGPPPD
ncbi:hypothetical protein LNP74_32520 [Klebsiella pneumoniae subsp. pneumoniae]|nr:hypothetical protein [Klebsiella pneumoniae subsp. pneumoniae]